MSALSTCHVLASEVLLDEDSAIGASLSALHECPPLVHILLCLVTGLPSMPRVYTLETHILVALWALNLFGFLLGLHYRLTLRSRAELLLTAHGNLMIQSKLEELLVGLGVYETFQEVVRDDRPATRLWAGHFVSLARLCDLKLEEVLQGHLTEPVGAYWYLEEHV